ncbi:MAG: hypothetical protein M3Y44_14715 [Actinomycetota bacterium]|nr:hypothetical protein [Actinomycetota bacterium]
MTVEWGGRSDAADGADEDLPGQGPPAVLPSWIRTAPPATWWALALVCVLAAVVLAVQGQAGPRPVAQASTTPAAPSSTVPAAGDTHLELVRYLALQPGKLAIYIRATGAAGGCPLVQPGTSPQDRIEAAVRRALPRFHLTDVGYTLDPFSGLCVLQVRARDGADRTLVVDVVKRRGAGATTDEAVESAISDGYTETDYAFAMTHGGWAVTVGSIGPAGRQPSIKYLRELAQDPATRW